MQSKCCVSRLARRQEAVIMRCEPPVHQGKGQSAVTLQQKIVQVTKTIAVKLFSAHDGGAAELIDVT